MYLLKWVPESWLEYTALQTDDKKLLKKVNVVIKDILRNGFDCKTGKCEMLKHDFSGYASVRLDKKNRVIFTVEENTVIILQCGRHYEDK